VAPPIRERWEDLQRQVDDTARETTTALAAVRAAPALLGTKAPRRYFVAFTTPAEARGLGGFMGNFGVLDVADGRFTLSRSERTQDIEPRPGDPVRRLDAPADYRYRYGPNKPQDDLRDITLSPDMPSVGQAIGSVFPQTPGGAPIDGVIVLDPYAVAGMLRLTGPVRLDRLAEPLTADNAAEILLKRQYEEFDGANAERIELLDEASHKAFDALIHQQAIEPARWAGALSPLIEQRRLMMWLADPAEQTLMERLGVDGRFPDPSGRDFFGLVTQNGGNNKIDIYLHRKVAYRSQWDPATGDLRATATVTLRNDAPATGLPGYVISNRPSSGQPDGTNWLWINFYSPHRLESATIDGRPLELARAVEFGMNVHHGYVAVPAKSTVTVELRLQGNVGLEDVRSVGDTARITGRYRVGWYQQPMVHPDDVTVEVAPARPWVADGPGDRTTAGRDVVSDRSGEMTATVRSEG
jgi:hypothetical protein